MRITYRTVFFAFLSSTWGCGSSPTEVTSDPSQGFDDQGLPEMQPIEGAAATVVRCTRPSLSVSPPSPKPAGTAILLTADADCTASTSLQYRFSYRLSSSGYWTQLRGWGAATYTFNTSNTRAAKYQLRAESNADIGSDATVCTIIYEITQNCARGFTSDGKGGCVDINECATNNGGCDPLTTCTNTRGSRTCSSCPSGYTGAGATGCIDINECATNNGGCDPLTTCTNTPGSRTCGSCPSGYTGTASSGCIDINECMTNNGGCDPLTVCTNTPGGYACGACPAGYNGTGDLGCTPIDFCITGNGGCDLLTTCTNTPTGAVCSPCPQGYAGSGNTGCIDIDECSTNNGGCDSLTVCTNTPGGRVCGACPAGYTGTGEFGCTGVDACQTNNGGCDALTVCTNVPGGHVCGACPSGYAGNGATGCMDIDECVTNNGGCDPLTACTNTPGSRACSDCPVGYAGTGAAGCTDLDECQSNNGGCDALTTCTNTPGGRTCSACPAGYLGTGDIGCSDIDECASNNGSCDSLTICTNTPGSRTCSACPPGYGGTGDTACRDIDECLTSNGGCDPLAPCINTPGSRTCGACPAGFTGSGDTACMDIDECFTGNGGCDALTLCTNTPGSRTCGACPAGYSGTGDAVCLDIDECAIANGGCDALTNCTNTVGSHQCGPCPEGYTGTGESGCVDINECSTTNGGCDPQVACTNTPGGRTCGPCPSGYSGTGDTACMLPFIATEIVGRPTDHSIAINAMAGQSLEAYVEYGTVPGLYASATSVATHADGVVQTVIDGLDPDTTYYYRLRYRPSGSTAAHIVGADHSFHTQRARGSSFTFAVQSDSHQGYQAFYNDALYRTTMGNILAAQPDFLIDLGDTVSTDDATETRDTVNKKYLNQRTVFDIAAHSTPIFLVLGNHENEEGWNLDDMGTNRQNSLPVLGANGRKRYFLNPTPDTFYSGNTDASVTEIDGDHLKGDYYAFEWGDALFVAIDPFWYTMKKPFAGTMGGEKNDETVGNRWDWTLGDQQYRWLTQTLESSTAKYKFVFAHQMTGGTDDYIRAGAKGAKYCEWGGYNVDGTTWAFESHRPGWAMPIHQLFVKTRVTAFFHGHDHVFATETLDGVIYQEVPHAANSDYGVGFNTNATDYAGGTLVNNSGYVRVTVTPEKVTAGYVRSFLPGAGTNGEVAFTYDMLSCDQRDTDRDGSNDCVDLCPLDPAKAAPGPCGCGKTEADTDGDGTADCVDACPDDPRKTSPGVCGCGRDDAAGCDQFTVVRVGDGGSALSANSTAAFLEQRRLDNGALVNTMPLPVAASGANKPLTLSGSAYVEGSLKRSVDGHFLTMGGYGVAPGFSNVAQTASSTPRVIARISANYAIDTTTAFATAFSGTSGNNANIRAVVSYDGSAFWAAGTSPTTNNTGGIWYVPFGTTSGTQITGQSGNNPLNVRGIAIFNNQLYGATNVSPFYGIFAVGAGLPTSRATATLLTGFPSSGTSAPVDFVVLDRNSAVPGVDTVYLADDRSGSGSGIQKWTLNGTTWTLAYTLNTGAVRHLHAVERADSVLLLAGSAPSSGSNAIIKIIDTGSNSTATTLVTAPTNMAFRGIALPPVP